MVAKRAEESETNREGAIVALDREAVTERLEEALAAARLPSLKKRVADLRRAIAEGRGPEPVNGNAVHLRRDILLADLDQILEARTGARARYYIKRLARGLVEEQTSPINDINLTRWKEYDEVLTDSLWDFARRDTSGAHLGWYWGNFIPQIPRQLMMRYTKRGDWVVDGFAGSATTLIECRRMGRNGLGIELNPETARRAREILRREENPYGVDTRIVKGDSRSINVARHLRDSGGRAQMVILHPPYHDIIRFSEDGADLSNANSTEAFLGMFGEVVENLAAVLDRNRYLALVIGDKYEKGEWVPLGFFCMQAVLERGFSLKSIVVKNFEETRAKREQKQLWRYRALAGGFYVFKHEYVFIFRKK